MDLFHKARIHFPRLDHPATQDDVEQGRAIFSLTGESRVWKMPAFPMEASWTTLKENPGRGLSFDKKEGQTTFIAYDTKGKVFQAEEVLVDGHWERFFGFVGAYHIAKVPASEIEFPARNRTIPLPRAFDSEIAGPGQSQVGGVTSIAKLGMKDALPVTLKIRNRSGLDQSVPGVAGSARRMIPPLFPAPSR